MFNLGHPDWKPDIFLFIRRVSGHWWEGSALSNDAIIRRLRYGKQLKIEQWRNSNCFKLFTSVLVKFNHFQHKNSGLENTHSVLTPFIFEQFDLAFSALGKLKMESRPIYLGARSSQLQSRAAQPKLWRGKQVRLERDKMNDCCQWLHFSF